jgi:protein-tyrosine-phosphatase
MKILFVCTANISRSFLAEQLLNYEIARLNLDHVCCASAGISALPGYPPDSRMVDFLREQGKSIKEHRSKPVTKELVDSVDLILVMERYHLQEILERWPGAEKKTRLFGDFLTDDGIIDDIIDPYGRSHRHYKMAQDQITLAVQNLIEKVIIPSKNQHA